jgi:hypothetical protein
VAKLRVGEANLVDVAAAAGAVWVATADGVMRVDPALVRSAAPTRAGGG